jgi:RNA polymerase sigma-70 factor, ECF subfamily
VPCPREVVNSVLEQLTDEALARKTRGGSLQAFEDLVSRYERRIYGFVLQFCSNPSDAAEITQETFLKAFRNIAQYNPRHPFPGWLFTIARHNCIDHHRAAPPFSDAPMPERAAAGDPAEALLSQEDRDGLWTLARRVLPPAQFEALWLTYATEMKVQDVARVMNRTSTHVKVMLFRARRTLRRALEETRPDFLTIKPAAERPLPHARVGGGAAALPIPGT